MAISFKRGLYLTHRWAGIVLCLFMAMWFVSGVVMMYVGYPKVVPAERLRGLPALPAACCVPPAQALQAGGVAPVTQLRLTSVGNHPVYVITAGRQRVAVDALSGERIREVGEGRALAAARAFLAGAAGDYLGLIDEDTWTHARALDVHRPLHKVAMHDPASTLLYVSSRTGEVVLDATRNERMWNYVGAWLHWLYPLRGGWADKYWTDVVIVLSAAGTVLALTGMVVGVLRWRFRGRFKSGARTPYRQGWMRWHHLIGLVFGTLALTWIFSGLMSMNPGKMFDVGPPLDLAGYQGQAALSGADLPDAAASLGGLRTASLTDVRELTWHRMGGEAYVVALDGAASRRVVVTEASGSLAVRHRVDPTRLQQAVARLGPHARVVRVDVLDAFDTYYYGRAQASMMGAMSRPLPVWRVVFDDRLDTWAHVDPTSGEVLGKLDRVQRVKRWVFAFLHSWDWPGLLAARPWWDVLLISLSVGGLLLCLTGVVVGWRRLVPCRRDIG